MEKWPNLEESDLIQKAARGILGIGADLLYKDAHYWSELMGPLGPFVDCPHCEEAIADAMEHEHEPS
jgi:hypothetical protein